MCWRAHFTGNPEISSTARATLDLYVPYAKDGELAADQRGFIVYQLLEDGTLTDITAGGKLLQNEDGDWVFRLRTRRLGTYLF